MQMQSAALKLMNQGFLSNFLDWVCCLRACHMYSLLPARVQMSLASCCRRMVAVGVFSSLSSSTVSQTFLTWLSCRRFKVRVYTAPLCFLTFWSSFDQYFKLIIIETEFNSRHVISCSMQVNFNNEKLVTQVPLLCPQSPLSTLSSDQLTVPVHCQFNSYFQHFSFSLFIFQL